ncbi:MAG: beta-lactamase family protein, partial [Rhodanobacteraceae bacterium]|nr:beta-lactamase family protein [Rhodanobacteraceae bacterium]
EPYAGAGVPVDAHTVFRLASVSKGFAGTLCGLLADAGFLSLNQSVVDLVPGLQLADPNAPTALTLERLLSHQTGLPHHTFDMNLEANAQLADLIQALPKVRPACAVGGCYAYQNVLFNVASDVAFGAVGSFFPVELSRRLLVPLGMRDTSVGREALLGSSNWARPHVYARGGWTPVEPKPTYYQLPAAAGVNASISDIALWMRAQLGERPDVLPPQVLDVVHSSRVDTPGELAGPRWRRERVRAAGYALGWRVFDYAGHTMVFHAGAVQGYRAMVALLPDQSFGVAVLWNSNSGVPGGLLPRIVDRQLQLDGPDWLELNKLQVAASRRKPRG